MDVPVTTTKPRGTIQSSLILLGEREKATLENKRHGVKREMLILLIFC
jgi:hypothetical protein